MNFVSKSALRYFQRHGNGRPNARDYRAMGRSDPFRNGQINFQPRLGFHLNTVERMIAKPSPAQAELRKLY